MECTPQMQKEHIESLATMKAEIRALKETVSDFRDIRDTLVELKLLNAQEIEFNRLQKDNNKEFADTLVEIRNSIVTLNTRVGNLEETDKQANERENKEDDISQQAVIEKSKSKWTLIGIIITGVLTLAGVIISIILK